MTRKKLARLMWKAIKRADVIEDPNYYIVVAPGACLVCALGAAVVEKFGGDWEKAETIFLKTLETTPGPGYKSFAKILGISDLLAKFISVRHEKGHDSIEQIAQWLESDPDWAEGWEANQP